MVAHGRAPDPVPEVRPESGRARVEAGRASGRSAGRGRMAGARPPRVTFGPVRVGGRALVAVGGRRRAVAARDPEDLGRQRQVGDRGTDRTPTAPSARTTSLSRERVNAAWAHPGHTCPGRRCPGRHRHEGVPA
ncbi:hypothetical protein GCM10009660_12850 [Catellatospora bangladeshensis]